MSRTGGHAVKAPYLAVRARSGQRTRTRTRRQTRTRRRPASGASPAWRLAMTGTVAVLISATSIVLAVLARPAARPAASPGHGTPGTAPAYRAPVVTGNGPAAPRRAAASAPRFPAATSRFPASAPRFPAGALRLTAADHRDCPAAATACVDLARHITWLQAGRTVTFGPVPMEPGEPGGKHQTPRGTFHVAWKAGPAYVSTIYHEAMPWATFFAAGGIAFHGGSLTQWSHGCVHLTMANAHYYNEHLPVGAKVVVF